MKYALVTGGSRGIGRAVCMELAARGFRVVVNYVSDGAAAAETLGMVRKANGEGELLQFDVADRDAVSNALREWTKAHPEDHIEVVVNNAGVRRDNLMMWMEGEDWDRVLEIGLDGFFNVTQPLLKDMLVRRNGRIVNIVSLSGLKGLPGQTNYSAAKGGMIAATKALAQEVAKKGVTVNAVAPGYIRTDMTADLNEKELKNVIPAGRFGTPEDVAAVVGFLVSPEAGYITGEVISVNGGLYT